MRFIMKSQVCQIAFLIYGLLLSQEKGNDMDYN